MKAEAAPASSAGHEETDRWDHSTRQEFFDYYAKQSLSEEARQRFTRQRDMILALQRRKPGPRGLEIADIGGGAGTLAQIWTAGGCRVSCLDVNEPLIRLAEQRAREAGFDIEFEVGSATDLPWPAASKDIVLAPELLEHVEDWERCLDEFARVLRPGGLLYLSTTNALCPRQQEFNLPAYSWYPGFVKRRYERLAKTTRPELANHATYPALHWFTFYGLRRALLQRGFNECLDRFEQAATKDLGFVKNLVLKALISIAPLQFLGHVCSPGTSIVAYKAD